MSDSRVSSRWQRLVAVVVFVAALFLYRSYENRPVLGLWSHAYAVVLLGALTLLGLTAIASWRTARAGRSPSIAARLADIAILVWSVAYLWSALDDPEAAGRVVETNFFGSVAPVAVLGEWVALCLGGAATVVWLADRVGGTGRNVLLSAAALSAVMLLGEGTLRLRAAVVPQTQGFPTNTSRQWTRRHVVLNDEGFRDVLHPKATPAGQKRLLLVGDSFAFGSGLNDVADRLGEQLKRFSNRPCTTWGGRGTSAHTDAGGPMRAYSMDLRERALLDSDAGMKAADVAAKYRVSGSWVRLLKQRRRETGEVAPRVQRHGRRCMLEPHLHTLAALIAAQPDRTLAELKDALATPASVPTVWRAVRGPRPDR